MKKQLNPIKYLKSNLFSSYKEGFISTALLILIGLSFCYIAKWIIFDAEWDVVTNNLNLYLFGSFPEQEKFRPKLWILMLVFLTLITLYGPKRSYLRKGLPILWIVSIPTGLVLLAGGMGLAPVYSRHWGGLTLTLILTSCSALIALPAGIALALGRQSKVLIIKNICRIYIDFMRAIPLISVLFFGQLLIPLFLPMDLEVNRVLRAVFAFSLFTAAYIAEDVRGGIQSIPQTQKEASAVLGLTPNQTILLVILPQALKTSLPALTNQAIGLLQNTSLMAILGLVELLGISQSLLANPQFIGRYLEVYIWLAFVYWIVCTSMALLSRHIERQLDTIKEGQ